MVKHSIIISPQHQVLVIYHYQHVAKVLQSSVHREGIWLLRRVSWEFFPFQLFSYPYYITITSMLMLSLVVDWSTFTKKVRHLGLTTKLLLPSTSPPHTDWKRSRRVLIKAFHNRAVGLVTLNKRLSHFNTFPTAARFC